MNHWTDLDVDTILYAHVVLTEFADVGVEPHATYAQQLLRWWETAREMWTMAHGGREGEPDEARMRRAHALLVDISDLAIDVFERDSRAYDRLDAIRNRVAHMDDGNEHDVADAVDIAMYTPVDDMPRRTEEPE